MSVMKKFSFLCVGIVTFMIGATTILQAKTDSDYILDYIDKCEADKTCSLLVQQNGEILYEVNQYEKLPLASMAKLVIAVEFAKQVSEGKIQRGEQVPLQELEKYYIKGTDGEAHPSWLTYIKENGLVQHEQVALEEVAKGMIHFSSNANTTYLQERLGFKRLNESLQELGLQQHDLFSSFTSALYMRGYVEKELKIDEKQSLKTLRDMSPAEYRNHVFQIHEWMKDEEEWKKRNIPLKIDMDFQCIWSDRLMAATAKDYQHLLAQINSRTVFSQKMYDELDNIFEGTVLAEHYEYAGQKGGSTAFVLTNSFYGTDKDGNKIEVVYMFNNLNDKDMEKITEEIDPFIGEVLTNKEFRNSL